MTSALTVKMGQDYIYAVFCLTHLSTYAQYHTLGSKGLERTEHTIITRVYELMDLGFC